MKKGNYFRWYSHPHPTNNNNKIETECRQVVSTWDGIIPSEYLMSHYGLALLGRYLRDDLPRQVLSVLTHHQVRPANLPHFSSQVPYNPH